MTAVQVLVALLLAGAIGALALAAWLGRKWPDPKTMPYLDAKGREYGRLTHKDAV